MSKVGQTSNKSLAIEAAEAHTGISVFHAIQNLAESPDISDYASQRDAERIVKICKSVMQRYLHLYDSALAEIK